MTDATGPSLAPASIPRKSSLIVQDARTKARNAAERRFRLYGMVAVSLGVLALVGLLTSILINGLSAFVQAKLTVPITITQAEFEDAEASMLKTGKYKQIIERNLVDAIAAAGIDKSEEMAGNVMELVSGEAPATVRTWALANPDRIGETVTFELLANGRIDGYYKGRVTMESAEIDSQVSPAELILADQMVEAGLLKTGFNWGFLTMGDASENRAEAAGLGVAILGSLYMMLIVLFLALPIGVAASIYLEELAPKNWITALIEVNISD